MKLHLYTIFDIKAQEAGEIFTAKNEQVAERMFQGTLAKTDLIARDDYILYKVGEFNTEGPEITDTEVSEVFAKFEREINA